MASNSRVVSDGFIAVTGAGGAVAPAVISSFLDEGHTLVLIDRPGMEDRALRTPRLAEAAAVGRLAVFGADLSSEAGTQDAFTAAAKRFGPCLTLINMAGGFSMAPAASASLDDLDRMLDVNLRSAVNATRAVLPAMLESGSGCVIAIGAGAALSPAPGRTAYAAAKAAVSAYFGSLAGEVGARGVGVAVLHPMGTIDTQPNRDALPAADPAGWISLDAVVEAIRYLATRPARGRVRELKLYAV